MRYGKKTLKYCKKCGKTTLHDNGKCMANHAINKQ